MPVISKIDFVFPPKIIIQHKQALYFQFKACLYNFDFPICLTCDFLIFGLHKKINLGNNAHPKYTYIFY